jgi:hypothetical protein
MLYEFRKYDIIPGKGPALLDRFGTFTVPKWQDRGFRVVGFWTPEMGAYSNQLVYILAWETLEERLSKFSAWRAEPERAKKWAETEKDGPLVRRVNNVLMEPTEFSQLDKGIPYGPAADGRSPYLFELREYEAMAGKTAALVQRFGGFTVGCFQKHGFRQVGYWTPVMGGHNHQLVYILAWESYEERARRFQEFVADPDRQRVFAESDKNGPLVERIAPVMMRPTPFSPMK